LEAQNAKLEAELEALRNRKQEDWKPIREMYEGELNQARNVIAELSSQKGVSEGKLANLEDQILSLKDLIAQYDSNAKDYVKKIDQLNSQVGEYEGELTTLRLRVGSLEDEVAKLRALIDKYKNENMRLRADLDAETAAHIEQEVLAQTKTEECEFLQELLDKLNLMQQEPIKVKGKDMELYFKGELRNAISECQRMYDDRLATTIEELENKYSLQMDQLRSGNVRDTMETEHAKSEIKRLRDQLSERNARLAELESALAAMRAERDNIKMRYSDLEQDFEREKVESSRKITELQMQVEALMQQLNELIDAKMSLELEIACYKKLLEGEESRTGLRSLVEQALGTTGSGGSALQDIIGQSSLSASTTAKTTVTRSSKGPLGFSQLDATGASFTLENTTTGARAKTQSMKGYKVVKKTLDDKVLVEIPLAAKDLRPGQSYTVFAKGAKSSPSNDNEQVAEVFSFGTGSSKWALVDEDGVEKATLIARQQQ